MKRLKKRFFTKDEGKEAKKAAGNDRLSPLVILHGRRRILLYDCKKILRYEREEILLLCGKERLLLRGNDLFCASFTSGAVTVEGSLASLAFLGDDGEGKA